MKSGVIDRGASGRQGGVIETQETQLGQVDLNIIGSAIMCESCRVVHAKIYCDNDFRASYHIST